MPHSTTKTKQKQFFLKLQTQVNWGRIYVFMNRTLQWIYWHFLTNTCSCVLQSLSKYRKLDIPFAPFPSHWSGDCHRRVRLPVLKLHAHALTECASLSGFLHLAEHLCDPETLGPGCLYASAVLRFHCWVGFPCWVSPVALVVKSRPANAGDLRDLGLIPGLGRSPGGGHGNPLQYSCLENPMDRGAWCATVHRVPQRWTQLKRLSTA